MFLCINTGNTLSNTDRKIVACTHICQSISFVLVKTNIFTEARTGIVHLTRTCSVVMVINVLLDKHKNFLNCHYNVFKN